MHYLTFHPCVAVTEEMKIQNEGAIEGMHLIVELQMVFVSHIVVIQCSIATTIKDEIAWYCNGIHEYV